MRDAGSGHAGLRRSAERFQIHKDRRAVDGVAPVNSEAAAGYVITAHARFEIERRGLTVALVEEVLGTPEQRLQVGPGRVVLQSRFRMGEPRTLWLVRVIVDVDRWPAEVVTAYRTSKVNKYWKETR